MGDEKHTGNPRLAMKTCASMILTLTLASAALAGAPLSFDEAVSLAVQQSKGAQISVAKAAAAEAAAVNARRQRYPRVQAYGLSGYYFRPIEVQLRRGALTPLLDNAGQALGMGPLSSTLGEFPANDLTLVRGGRTETIGAITVLQPLSQLWRIDSGVRAARAEAEAALREGDETTRRIKAGVEQLFAAIQLEDARRAAYEARVAHARQQLKDAENAVAVGERLEDAALGARAALVSAQTDLTRGAQQRARHLLQLADLIGRAGDEQIEIVPALPDHAVHPLEYWLAKAERNPATRIAAALADKAEAGTRAARQAYIPELSAFATGFAQDGMPLLPEHGGTVGLTLTWDLFDFGRRGSELARSRSLQRAASLDQARLQEEARRQVRIAYQDFTHAGELVSLAEQNAAYRRSAAELARRNVDRGLALPEKALAAEADLRQAEADLLGARLQRHLALLTLATLVGE